MIKAAEGGGGKGIRKVEAAEEFGACFRQVRGALSTCPVPVLSPQPGWDAHWGFAPISCILYFPAGLSVGTWAKFQRTVLKCDPPPSTGAGRGTWVPHLPDEAGPACTAPGGAGAG